MVKVSRELLHCEIKILILTSFEGWIFVLLSTQIYAFNQSRFIYCINKYTFLGKKINAKNYCKNMSSQQRIINCDIYCFKKWLTCNIGSCFKSCHNLSFFKNNLCIILSCNISMQRVSLVYLSHFPSPPIFQNTLKVSFPLYKVPEHLVPENWTCAFHLSSTNKLLEGLRTHFRLVPMGT